MIQSSDMSTLRRELEAAGVFEHVTGATLGKFALLVVVAAGMLTTAALAPTWVALGLVALAAVPLTTAVMIGHEAGHRSLAVSPRVNELVYHIIFPLIGGLGALHWKNKHNVNHHGFPNVAGTDDDINLWPMALTPSQHAASGPVRRVFQRYLQGWLFWPLTLTLPLVMRVESLRYLGRHVARRGFDRAARTDLVCLALHYGLWLGLGSVLVGPLAAIVSYLVLWAVVGVLLALIFAPAHIGLPIVESQEKGWAHQLASTRNMRLPDAISWFMIGLDRQVEHHLFPTIPHQHLPAASAIVQRWCERVGLPWQQIGGAAAVADATRFIASGWRLDGRTAEAPALAATPVDA